MKTLSDMPPSSLSAGSDPRSAWAFQHTPTGPPFRGFTLLETIGVMAIVAIMAAVITPVVIKKINQAAVKQESVDLPVMAEVFKQAVLRDRTGIPTNWDQTVADELALPPNRIVNSPAGVPRAFLVDPNFRLGGAGLPFTQKAFGMTSAPVSPRLMILSSRSQALPSVATSNDFNTIWNTREQTVPTNFPSAWAGKAEDLAIQRIDMTPWFKRVIINNLDTNYAFFKVDQGTLTNVPPAQVGWQAYYLDNTIISFFDSKTNVQSREFLASDRNYDYENDTWLGGIKDGRTRTNPQLLISLGRFLSATNNPSAKHYAQRQHIVITLYDYMWTYAKWAEADFQPKQGSDQAHILMDIQGDLQNWSKDLISK